MGPGTLEFQLLTTFLMLSFFKRLQQMSWPNLTEMRFSKKMEQSQLKKACYDTADQLAKLVKDGYDLVVAHRNGLTGREYCLKCNIN